MKEQLLWGVLAVVLLLLSGCGGADLDIETEEPGTNSATGTIRQGTVVAKEEHLHSHYYGAAGSEEEGKHVLMLHNGVDSLREGHAIAFGRTKQFPNGLMRKVEAIYEQDDKTKVVTSQAGLDDIFEDLTITHSVKLKPALILEKDEMNLSGSDVVRVLYEKKGVSLSLKEDSTDYKKHDLTIDLSEVELVPGATLGGSIGLSLTFHLKIQFHTICTQRTWVGWPVNRHVCTGWKTVLGHTYFYIEPEESGEVTLSVTKSCSIDKEKTLGEYTFSPIDIQVGPIPVIIVPKLRFIVDAYGEVSAGMSMGFSESFSSEIGITHKKKRGHSRHHWYPLKSMRHDVEMIPPHFVANGKVKVSTGPLLELLIYDVTGPIAELNTYLEADADLSANPWWTLSYGVEAGASFVLEVADRDFADVSYSIFDYQHPLAHSN
jgi:hypothetical protein